MTFPRHACARLDVPPEVPTVPDFVPGYEASGFAGQHRAVEQAAQRQPRRGREEVAKVLKFAGIRAE